MKLRRLAIERLPGIERPFELEELGDGLNIILGPNGAGKSRLCAATQALLWREHAIRGGGLSASALFDHEGAHWRAQCDGSRHGWQRDGVDSAPPPLPAEHLHGCFFLGLRDLLDDSDGAGSDLAGEIRRQMSGGFDLEAVRRRFEGSVSKQLGRKETKAVGSAENAIRKAEQQQAGIVRQEQTLDGLTADAAAAASAQRRLAHYDTALALKASQGAHAQCESDLAELPKAIAQLDGKELERLEGLDGELAQKRSDRETADKALADCAAGAAASRLDEPIDGTSLATWRARAEKLAELDRDLHAALLDAHEARETLASRQRVLGSPADGGTSVGSEGTQRADLDAPVSLADDADLYAFLRESQQVVSERDSLMTRLAQLASHAFSEEDARRRDRLERACESLRDWLRAPDPELRAAAATLWPPRAYLAIAGVTAMVLGLVLHFAFHFTGAGAAVGASGLGLLVAALLTRLQAPTSSTPDWRVVAEQRFPLDETLRPARWTRDAVGESLHQLEHDHAELVARAKQHGIREVEREQLAVALQRLDGPLAELESKRHELAERLGLDALRPDAELVDLARALDEVRSAHADASRAAARCDVLKQATTQRLADIAAFLTGLGEDAPTDAAAARAGIHSLEERDRSLRRATDNAKRESETRDRLDGKIGQLARDRAQIFQLAGLEEGDRVALTRLLDQLDRYRELTRAREDHASGMRHAKATLEAAGEDALARLDATRLGEEKAALAAQAERIQELNHKIGEITALARAARAGHDLEDAIASRSAAIAALRDRRDQALAAEAGKFLIEGIREEHESNQMPKVLERARRHFATFTHHRYELTVSPSNDASFVAIDAKSRLGLSPEKLSDGTRGQLVLAARLAFAEEAERGAALPLFLDEALEHSDPERFQAIARSLARMVVDDGRQIFYLSNDPTDVDRFRAAFDEENCRELKRIDLAAIRGQAASVAGPASLRVAPLAPVPNPVGQTPESYGLAIGVASLEPGGAIPGHSLYYLLRDALPLLYEFLQARIETVGQCQNVLRQGGSLAQRASADGSAGAELEDRIALFETFCLAWRTGRGSKLGRLELEKSGVVSDTYLDRATEFLTETGSDARSLIDAIRQRSDARFKGFRAAAVGELERWLMENGYIDEKPILNEDEIVAHALDTPAASRIPLTTATRLLHEWWSLSERPAAAG